MFSLLKNWTPSREDSIPTEKWQNQSWWTRSCVCDEPEDPMPDVSGILDLPQNTNSETNTSAKYLGFILSQLSVDDK